MAASTSPTLKLPTAGGQLESYTPRRAAAFAAPDLGVPFTRIAYSAAHVVADPRSHVDPWLDAALDWDATIAYRQRLWSLGLGVAEAMDTAQRGMGLDWPTSLELIRRSLDAARDYPGALVASGCGTDHLVADASTTVDDVIAAYEEQMGAIERHGGRLIVMASRALAKVAKSPADYERVYDRALMQAKQPVILHWLGDMFDPALAGYWGSSDVDTAMTTALGVIAANPGKVDGIKISLLDKGKEIAMRRRLPEGVRMYTGDDFNYAELIAGDGTGAATNQQHSDALLGIFDAIAPAASAALSKLAANDLEGFHAILAPTVPLSRHIFKAPTRFYKTGIVFLAWLNGHQSHFTMVGGQQSARSMLHFAEGLQARRCGRPARATRTRHSAHAPAAGAAWHRGLIAAEQQQLPDRTEPMRDFSADHRWLSINTATLRGAGGLDTIIEACARHGIRAISPWRDQVAAIGLARTAVARYACTAWLCRATAAAACTPATMRQDRVCGAGRQPACHRRGEDARRGLPGARCRRGGGHCRRGTDLGRARQGPDGRPQRRARRHRRHPRIRALGRHAAGHRAAASDVCGRPCLRQHAGTGARPLR